MVANYLKKAEFNLFQLMFISKQKFTICFNCWKQRLRVRIAAVINL